MQLLAVIELTVQLTLKIDQWHHVVGVLEAQRGKFMLMEDEGRGDRWIH